MVSFLLYSNVGEITRLGNLHVRSPDRLSKPPDLPISPILSYSHSELELPRSPEEPACLPSILCSSVLLTSTIWAKPRQFSTGTSAPTCPRKARRPAPNNSAPSPSSFTTCSSRTKPATSSPPPNRKPPMTIERSMLRVTRRDFDKATRVPTSLITELTETCSLSEEVWQKARTDNDYPTFAPYLEKILHLKRQYAAAVAPGTPIYDALLDDYEEGMTTATLDPLFATLKKETIPLVAAIAEQTAKHATRGQPPFDEPLTRDFATRRPASLLHPDPQRLRLPLRPRPPRHLHRTPSAPTSPKTTSASPPATKITGSPAHSSAASTKWATPSTRLNINPAFEATPLAGGVSLGVHESQSRLWENIVGRSREFWTRYYPLLQKTFPTQLANVPLDAFYSRHQLRRPLPHPRRSRRNHLQPPHHPAL